MHSKVARLGPDFDFGSPSLPTLIGGMGGAPFHKIPFPVGCTILTEGPSFVVQHGITEKVKGSIATMLTLASSQGDGLYKELAGKYIKSLHKG